MGIGRLLVLAGLAQLQLRVEGFLAPPSLPAAAAASDSGSSRTRQSPEALPTPFQYEDGRRLRASNGSVAAARRNGCGRGTSSWPLAATGSPGTKGAGAGAGNEAAAAAAAAARVYNVRENIESNSRVASEVYKTLMEPDKKQKAKTAVRKTVSKTPRPKVPGDDDDDGDGSVWMRSRLIEDREELSAEEREEAQDRIAEQAVEDGFLVGPEGKKRLVQPQDYLVHADIGVCRFVGIANVTDSKTGLLQDVIKLEFKETVLEVPLEQSTRLTRFRSRDRKSRLSRYDDYRNWIRKREKAMQKVKRQAGELLTLYKERSVLQRPACRPDGEDSMEFDSKFPFTLTPDQARCVEEIMQDMVWSKRPMDRLLCGDVGFGKTEVAMRAIYRAVRNGRQVAMLAPTTILAAQHYRTLRKRLPDHVSLAYLRSGKSRESDVIKMQMANGTMDVVVGTHSLLTRRISIKNLGLLVVDEEQRFGVHQKETMKAMNQGVDVLTMTATPIPRTLHMSLSGIRDLSTIFSPPEGRQNVTTYVMKSSDEVLVKAITRELKRGGQVFYVCPRIAQIDREYERLATLMPDVRIIVAHSKIGDLDDVVLNFASGAGQVLLSTSVIESGIDMPNVNSIIVRDAYKFGECLAFNSCFLLLFACG
jgi:transcription-repair coupling factor (superfamily II helicase)